MMVTGGAGFIGSALVDRLLGEGHHVDVVDDLTSGTLINLVEAREYGAHAVSFHRLDVRSPEIVGLIARRQPEVIFHLAAQANLRVSVERPVFDAEVNVLGTLRVLEGARAAGVTRVVFAASGSTLYGEPDAAELPVKESHPQGQRFPYGVSEKAALAYLAAYRELYALEFCALVLANVYGPRQDPYRAAGVVAVFADRLYSGEPLVIFGDGEQTRDFVYIDDVVDALVLAATSGGGLVLNVGTGREVSVNELAQVMREAVPGGPEPVHGRQRPGELRRNALDAERAGIHLGWWPTTALEDGVRFVLDRSGTTYVATG
ncbi:MAG: NAD-dependent epimerase/dehydratase family protein [Acidimicrobiales bacterium]